MSDLLSIFILLHENGPGCPTACGGEEWLWGFVGGLMPPTPGVSKGDDNPLWSRVGSDAPPAKGQCRAAPKAVARRGFTPHRGPPGLLSYMGSRVRMWTPGAVALSVRTGARAALRSRDILPVSPRAAPRPGRIVVSVTLTPPIRRRPRAA